MEKFYRFSIAGLPCIILLSIPLCGLFAQVQTPRSIQTGPNSYGFQEYLPAGYSADHAPYPLMVFLSGEWQQGDGTAAMLPLILQYGPPQIIAAGQWPDSFKVAGHTFQYVIISPQFTIWESETDIDDVINYALAHYNVDPSRVYLTGYSAGGGMTWAYAGYSNAFANKIAAIVPVSAAIGINDQQAHTIALNNVPVYTQHNIDDSTVGYQFCLANVAAVNRAAPRPEIPAIDTIFPNRGFRHNAWTVTYCACFLNPAINNYSIYQWMLQYSRTSGTVSDLPVRLTAYSATATANGTQVNVAWSTAQEVNNKYFIVQRSADTSRFDDLDTVAAAAPRGGGHSYAYVDRSPLAGPDFYRLEQVDLDGKKTYYWVLEVQPGVSTVQELKISPNPASGLVHIHLVHPGSTTLQVSLSDIQGKTWHAWSFLKQDTNWDQSIDLSGLPMGTYELQLNDGTMHEVRTILKQ
jgi:type IX secretion system substrate protein